MRGKAAGISRPRILRFVCELLARIRGLRTVCCVEFLRREDPTAYFPGESEAPQAIDRLRAQENGNTPNLLRIKIMFESNPLKSIMFVRRLAALREKIGWQRMARFPLHVRLPARASSKLSEIEAGNRLAAATRESRC